MDRPAEPEERFEATLKLAAMPRNGVEGAHPQPLHDHRAAAGLLPKFGLSRIALRELASDGQVAGRGQGELVRGKRAHGDERSARRHADPHP